MLTIKYSYGKKLHSSGGLMPTRVATALYNYFKSESKYKLLNYQCIRKTILSELQWYKLVSYGNFMLVTKIVTLIKCITIKQKYMDPNKSINDKMRNSMNWLLALKSQLL